MLSFSIYQIISMTHKKRLTKAVFYVSYITAARQILPTGQKALRQGLEGNRVPDYLFL